MITADLGNAVNKRDRLKGRLCLLFGMGAALSALLLFALPAANAGLKALLNRLFTVSEAYNTYVYTRFDVPEGQSVLPAQILLALIAVCVILCAAVSRKPLLILCCTGVAALGQVYFGLSFPGWLNVILFGFFGWLLVPEQNGVRRFALYAGIMAVTALLVCVYNPGTDVSIESLSESVRDRLSGALMQSVGGADGSLQPPVGVRHVNSRALRSGESPAETEQEFREVLIEQEEISRPDPIARIRGAFPFVLAAVAVIYLGIRLFRLTVRRKKVLAERERFCSENISEAVCAMFRHIALWLTYAGCGSGNRPYRDWAAGLDGHLPPEYIQHYEACVPVFEEAAFSDHSLNEQQRSAVRDLLDETENLIYARADRKERLRLRYTLCLHK